MSDLSDVYPRTVVHDGGTVRLVGVHPLFADHKQPSSATPLGRAEEEAEARLAFDREGETMASVTEAAPPRRVEAAVLVLEQFLDSSGAEWRPGDRAPLHSRAVRQVAMERPELFVMEYETAPVDLDWLRELDLRYEAEFQQAKERRDEREAGREKALRDEMKAQDTPQPDLERRYKRQEADRAEWEKQVREERERKKLEGELALQRGSGFHVF